MRVAAASSLLAAAALALLPRAALAYEGYEGTRALGMGGATRAWALGSSGPLLNPSGMSLAKTYDLEAAYGYASRDKGNYLHASIVDSTSETHVAGGLYYTYHSQKPSDAVSGHGHEFGFALSVPLSYLSIGATAKWFSLDGVDQGPSLSTGGLTFDVGLTAHPIDRLSFAVVGANLRDLHSGQAPQTVSYGAAFVPVSDVVLAVDGVTSFTRDDHTGLRGTGVRGGAEATFLERYVARAGGGTDAMTGTGYLSGGVSAVSELGALDFGIRGDLWTLDGPNQRNIFVGVGLRLFVGSLAVESAGGEPGGPSEQNP